jgi:uncharacterized membrane protein
MTFSFRFGTAALIASLALNAALGGYVGVSAWRRHQFMAGQTPPGFLRMVRWRLPAADKAILDDAVAKKEDAFTDAQADAQKAMRAAIAALRNPNFNEADFRAAVAAVRDKRVRQVDLGLDVFVDAMAHVSPEGRVALVPRRAR